MHNVGSFEIHSHCSFSTMKWEKMLAHFWKWFYINSYVYKAVLKGFQILRREIGKKLHFMIESLHKWCKNHDFDLLPPLCPNFHTIYPNKHWKTTQSCLMKMTGGGWWKMVLFRLDSNLWYPRKLGNKYFGLSEKRIP